MTTEDQIQLLKSEHDKLQEGLLPSQMAIREGIIVRVKDGAYDSYPRYGFQFFCWRSPEMVREMDLFVKYAKGKRLFWDIGAYHGVFSLVFNQLNPEGVVVAFEPLPSAFNELVDGFKEIPNMFLSPSALSDKNGKILMSEHGGHFEVSKEGTTEVECIQGDIVGNSFKIPPDLLKIDVEGAELSVLEGLYGVISAAHPVIFLELHCGKLLGQPDIPEIIYHLKKWEYRAIDTRTGEQISYQEIHRTTEGELRLILE